MEQAKFNRVLIYSNIAVAALLIFSQILSLSFLNRKIEDLDKNTQEETALQEENETKDPFSIYTNSDFQFKTNYLADLSPQELETTDDNGKEIKDLLFSLGFLNTETDSYSYSIYIFKNQISAQSFLSQFLKARAVDNKDNFIIYEDENQNSLALKELNKNFFILAQEDTRPEDFEKFKNSLESTEAKQTNCVETYERKTKLENSYRNNFYQYSFNQYDLNRFKQATGIKNWCVPSEYSNLIQGPDWNTYFRNKAYRSESGRKIILGVEKYLNKEKEEGEVLIEYSTYNFVANAEFNTYITKSDYFKARNNTSLEEINKHKVYVKFQKVLENNEYIIEKTYIFPKNNYYLAISYRFPKHYANNEEGIRELEKDMKDTEENNIDESRKKDLDLLESFAKSVEFILAQ